MLSPSVRSSLNRSDTVGGPFCPRSDGVRAFLLATRAERFLAPRLVQLSCAVEISLEGCRRSPPGWLDDETAAGDPCPLPSISRDHRGSDPAQCRA